MTVPVVDWLAVMTGADGATGVPTVRLNGVSRVGLIGSLELKVILAVRVCPVAMPVVLMVTSRVTLAPGARVPEVGVAELSQLAGGVKRRALPAVALEVLLLKTVERLAFVLAM